VTSTRLFWLRPPADSQSREVDPIGMSSLHEAAANVLLPNISGRTREASDYLWTLIGLREGGEDGSSRGRTDAEIWQSFACFEKALKMYWYESRCQPRFDGIKAVRWQDDHGREDLDFQLLSNQRSQGLLGAYVRSLREAGLVESRSLRLSAPGKTLVSSVNLRWGGKLTRQWRGKFEWATHELTSPAGREMKVALGQKLFCPQEMCGAATPFGSSALLPNGPRRLATCETQPSRHLPRSVRTYSNCLRPVLAPFGRCCRPLTPRYCPCRPRRCAKRTGCARSTIHRPLLTTGVNF
jgi:hypothetical protein